MIAQLLLRKPEDVSLSIKAATQISASMDRLDLMIHDLLDASRLRAGEQLELSFEECDLDSLIQQMAEEVNCIYEKRIQYDSIGPVKGNWNERALRRIVDNLISNALKFSPNSSAITIKLDRRKNGIEFSIHNIGSVISPEELSILFETFSRAKTAQGKMGWGIGLTVVKGLAEAHGGKAEVQSTESDGTTFKIKLPLNA